MLIYCTIIEEEQQNGFERMYEQYCQLMYHVALDILQDSYLAEDAVSEAFWKAAENYSKISEPVSPKTKRFLVIICERTAIDLYRKRKKQDAVSLDEMEYEQTDAAVSVLPEEEGTLEAAIARLPKAYREVILLRYSFGYSINEIAKLLDFSEAKVSKCITRGKKKLAELLEQEEYV
ncbi:MAG: sigma-70 family RNA polymerase sigma factor [Clostridia bacterium]|nr:sigma-70 family RNA polymerase sigma factor [Clostridia bacterium]